MRLGFILAALSIPNLVRAAIPYQVSDEEGALIASTLNDRVRTKVTPHASRMKRISYNPGLAAAMRTYMAGINPSYLFQNDTNNPPIPGYLRNMPVFHLQFADYPDCKFWVLDTFDNRTRRVVNLFDWRIAQQDKYNCFNYPLCSNTEYTDYNTCDRIQTHTPGTLCAGGGRYWGEYTREEIESFACVATGIPGPAEPKRDAAKQNDGFFCMVCAPKPAIAATSSPTTTPPPRRTHTPPTAAPTVPQWPTNDIPYATGAKASDCDYWSDYRAENGLCVPEPITNSSSGLKQRLRH